MQILSCKENSNNKIVNNNIAHNDYNEPLQLLLHISLTGVGNLVDVTDYNYILFYFIDDVLAMGFDFSQVCEFLYNNKINK